MTVVFLIVLLVFIPVIIYRLYCSEKSQLFGNFPWQAGGQEKVVALTFDDGPNQPYTMQIVNFLNEKKIKATFFQVGECVKKFPEITKKIDQSGHVIGNHSLSHAFHNYLINPSFETEIVQSQRIFKDLIGKQPALFRPPWLWHYARLFKTLRRHKLQAVSGTFCHPLEVFQIDSQKIAGRTLAKVKPGSIIIFHDGYNSKAADRSQTVAAAKIVVDELIKKNYKFVTVDKLLNIPAYL